MPSTWTYGYESTTPNKGIGAVKSDLLWGIWQRFWERDREIPYPQRDLHLKSIPEAKDSDSAK